MKIKELERRLSSVVAQALEDCGSVDDAFKLLASFEGLLERDLMQNNLEKYYIGLLTDYHSDLKAVQTMFLHKKDKPPIYNNMPPIGGALHWSRGLAERADSVMPKFRQCSKTILESDEMSEVSASNICMFIYIYGSHISHRDRYTLC